MSRIMRCRLPPFIIFIILCICSNWLSSWFTAGTDEFLADELRWQLVHEQGDTAPFPSARSAA